MKLTLGNLHTYCEACGPCLLWKLGCNSQGYPQARVDGKTQNVRRYVYGQLLGRQLRRGEVVTTATTCDRVNCVSPDCLVRMSYGRLIATTYQSGKRSVERERAARRAQAAKQCGKLSMEIAAKLRPGGEWHDVPTLELATRFNCCKRTINTAKAGKSWFDPPREGSSIFALASTMGKAA